MKYSWDILIKHSSIKQTKIASTYSGWDCVECKDFRNVGDLFHPLRPAKASFNAMHYWLRPIKRGQFRFANFAPHLKGKSLL